ncbi:Glycinamide ribonucleotide synthetase [Hyphodiscus hymeniophilus]|uniref:Glycinamide ribonucleotide synthetase n=1 Tax=Hyphodiscus hymeniophilus TaxID=353542 RepID=A0A9P7AW34_9HELO|nr:Glycinamide ribonucleotide synthetase [Hyphodiscus hymeniophilus]
MEQQLRILLIGNGGREHALAWKLSQSPLVESIIAVPGNGGTATCPKVSNDDTVKADDYHGLVALAQRHNVNMVVPGPEAPLVDGIEGYFRAVGIRCYGPSKLAARMEGSKTFSKDFMKKYNIPTAAYENFSNYEDAKRYLESVDHDVVLKASGLAAGKGVIIPTTKLEAQNALKEIMLDKEFGSAGDEIVIEEFLEGEELSILSFCDGFTFKSLPPAQDHKRIYDGDQGPNTGGMGCYAPTAIATKTLIDEVERTVLQPTIDGFIREHMPFRGTLFTGLMITKNGPKVLEYNVRFGDPETQTLLPLLSSDTDLAEIMVACTEGWLKAVNVKVDQQSSATVVVAAGGYPGSYAKGTPIKVSSPPSNTNIFHAGTIIKNKVLQTSGGRVIAAQAVAENLEGAVKNAYAAVVLIEFDKMFFRKDIAHRALKPQTTFKEALTYASAGVDIDAGNVFVNRIKKAVASTKRAGADAEIGGFGGEVDLQLAGYTNAPVMVGAIDGVGTKLLIAQAMKKHDTVGIDLVAMNVNDLIVQGAEPLMFLDYYGCSQLNLEIAAAFVEGVAAGCRDANCALVGGETAEMPGMYKKEDYDAAGTAIGAMSKDLRLPRLEAMADGDVLIGLASDGVHSNGFSLVRAIIRRENRELLATSSVSPPLLLGLQAHSIIVTLCYQIQHIELTLTQDFITVSYDEAAPWCPSTSIGLSLLTPTKIYVRSLLPVIKKKIILGLSHITGGGLTENIPRMLPPHLTAEVDLSTWQLPAVFKWLKQAGNIASLEMGKTFNNGVGMVAVVKKENLHQVVSELTSSGETVYTIGRLVPRTTEGCVLKNLESWD